MRRRFAALGIALSAASALLIARPSAAHAETAAEKAAASAPASARRQRELQAEQKELQARLAQLKRRLAASEATHSEAADQLAESEAAISVANRRLRELNAARQQVQRQVAALQERGRSVGARQSDQERQLGDVLRMQYLLARQDPWQRLIDGDNPNRIGRDLQYLAYIARAKAELIDQLRDRREEIDSLAQESRAKQAELTAIATDERKNRAQLLREQANRKGTLARLAKQITAQRRSIASLERDEQRLGGLIEQIGKLLAEQARREAQRRAREAAARARRNAAPPGGQPPTDPDPPAGSNFAGLRGKMLLPIKGELIARFGSARTGVEGGAAPTYKGIFIRAPAGTDVHAIAAGRVVFADWLRGFGNLLIVDHGEGYLSVYGNNESLYKNAGDRIESGAVIAAVGNTGGNPEAGLYFELRFQGRPFDPLKWAVAR